MQAATTRAKPKPMHFSNLGIPFSSPNSSLLRPVASFAAAQGVMGQTLLDVQAAPVGGHSTRKSDRSAL